VGHTRYKAAQQLGMETVPVHVAVGLTPAQAKAYRIADNQTALIAGWDFDRLPIELTALKDSNFNLDLLGFGPDELAKTLNPELADGLCDPDDVGIRHFASAKVRLAEAWRIQHGGRARAIFVASVIHSQQTLFWSTALLWNTLHDGRRTYSPRGD
jgi:ParB-like chromosome segregation protein Spo0J